MNWKVKDWLTLLIAAVGAAVVWGSTTTSLAAVETRVEKLETQMHRIDRIEQRLVAIHCHLDPGACLTQGDR